MSRDDYDYRFHIGTAMIVSAGLNLLKTGCRAALTSICGSLILSAEKRQTAGSCAGTVLSELTAKKQRTVISGGIQYILTVKGKHSGFSFRQCPDRSCAGRE